MPQQDGLLVMESTRLKHMVMPITSYPWLFNNAAATEESTPPLIATTTRSFIVPPLFKDK
jgi:hypothetical protein